MSFVSAFILCPERSDTAGKNLKIKRARGGGSGGSLVFQDVFLLYEVWSRVLE